MVVKREDRRATGRPSSGSIDLAAVEPTQTAARDGFTVQQAARLTGLSEHNLRFYERAGLLTNVTRDTSSRHRRYSARNIEQFRMLACLRNLGMSLDDMRRYFEQAAQGTVAAAEQVTLLEDHESALEQRIAQMHRTLDQIRIKTDYWRAMVDGEEERARELVDAFSRRLQADLSTTAPSD